MLVSYFCVADQMLDRAFPAAGFPVERRWVTNKIRDSHETYRTYHGPYRDGTLFSWTRANNGNSYSFFCQHFEPPLAGWYELTFEAAKVADFEKDMSLQVHAGKYYYADDRPQLQRLLGVITVSIDWIYGAITVPGATGGWHTLSHHAGKAEALAKLTRIELDIVKHLNKFLVDLDGIKEEGGSLLDHTTVVIGSNFGDASNHTCRNLPTVVAGGGYRHQTHTALEKPTPLCNLYLDLLHEHQIDVSRFGSSTGAMGLLRG